MEVDGDESPDPVLGLVPLEGRGSLPFALVHGESLVAAASWAVGEAGIQLVDANVTLADVRRSGRMLLLHDPLCPLTPPEHLVDVVARARRTGRPVVSVRPVTDTVKQVFEERVGATVPRDDLVNVASPIAIPGQALAALDAPRVDDFAALFEQLAAMGEVELVEAPLLARRVTDEDELRLLEALSRASV